MRRILNAKVRRIRELREQKLSLEEIAKRENLGRTTVWRYTRDIKVQRSRQKSDEVIRENIKITSLETGELDEVKKAYLAGLFDGEGSISIRKYRERGHLNIMVSVTNTDPDAIMSFSRLAEGRMVKEDRTKRGWKPVFRFIVSTYDSIVKFLEALLPYLKIKKRQAERMLTYCKSRLSHRNKRSIYTREELRVVEGLRNLNKRGVTYG